MSAAKLENQAQSSARQEPGAAEKPLPGASNSPVASAVGMDWLTVVKLCAGREIEEILGLTLKDFGTTGTVEHFGHGYSGVDVAAYGRALSRSDSVLVDLPAQALEHIRTTKNFTDQQIVAWFLEHGFHATRVDIAIDTPDRRINPRLCFSYWMRSLVCASVSVASPHVGKLRQGEAPPRCGRGWTVYFGSRASQRFMRVYDKAAEIEAKTGKREFEHLTRFEQENRHEAARELAAAIAQHGTSIIPSLFAGWIDFKDPRDGHAQKSKRKSAAWWRDLLAGAGKQYLQLSRKTATPERTRRWTSTPGFLRALKALQTYGLAEDLDGQVKETVLTEKQRVRWFEWALQNLENPPDGLTPEEKLRWRRIKGDTEAEFIASEIKRQETQRTGTHFRTTVYNPGCNRAEKRGEETERRCQHKANSADNS